jgi:hypothetical protein
MQGTCPLTTSTSTKTSTKLIVPCKQWDHTPPQHTLFRNCPGAHSPSQFVALPWTAHSPSLICQAVLLTTPIHAPNPNVSPLTDPAHAYPTDTHQDRNAAPRSHTPQHPSHVHCSSPHVNKLSSSMPTVAPAGHLTPTAPPNPSVTTAAAWPAVMQLTIPCCCSCNRSCNSTCRCRRRSGYCASLCPPHFFAAAVLLLPLLLLLSFLSLCSSYCL